VIWLNGEFRKEGAAIDVSDRGFLLGDGAFETLYVEHGRAAFLAAHLDRLRRGLAVLKIAAPAALSDMRAVIARLARDNELGAGAASARITVTRGPGARGLAFPGAATPTVLVTLAPAPAGAARAQRLVLSPRIRYSGAAGASFKSIGGYVENVLAFNEARAAGGDDALLLNEKGRVASTARANIFVIDDEGSVATPPTSEGAMPGVVRALLIDAAGDHGVRIEEAALAAGDLVGAPLFATNSLLGLVPASLAGEEGVAPHDVLRRLQSWYQERLRRDFAEQEASE
jgi:branched-chain amino acid aminotransferase